MTWPLAVMSPSTGVSDRSRASPRSSSLTIPAVRQHQVRRFYVAVDQVVVVGVLESQGRLPDDFAGIGDRQRAAGADQSRQVDPIDELGDEEVLAVHLVGVHRLDDVGVVEPTDRLHLPLETSHGLRVAQPPGGQHLDGHQPFEPRVDRAL